VVQNRFLHHLTELIWKKIITNDKYPYSM
jgi:hypothetical protein